MPVKNLSKDDREDQVFVDINDPTIAEGIEQDFDANEDFQARACPPPAGIYQLALFLGGTKPEDFEELHKQGFSKDDPNGVYYKKQLLCKIQDEGGAWHNSILDYNLSTGVSRGKRVSNMAGLLAMLGVKVPAKITDRGLSQLCLKVFKKIEETGQNKLWGECDWAAWSMDQGKFVKKGMKNFPPDGKGGYQHILVNPKTGEEAIAKCKVTKWLGRNRAPQGQGAAKPTQAVATATPTQARPAQARAAAAAVEPNMDDFGEVVLEG